MSAGGFPASWPRLLAIQVRAQLRQFARVPIALFFTLVLPLTMLLIFNSIFAGEQHTIVTPAGNFPVRQFYVGSLAAFTAVSATFTYLANTIPERRQQGILRRWRGTPMPPAAYLAGYLGSAVVVALVGVVVMVGTGVAFYGTVVDVAKLPAALATFLVAVAAWSALGVAVAGLVRSPESAPAVANGIILPLGFISDTFIPMSNAPRWLVALGDIFPLKPFVQALQGAFNPLVEAPAFEPVKLAQIAAWGIAGAIVAAKTFKWDPVGDRGTGSRHRRRRATAPGT